MFLLPEGYGRGERVASPELKRAFDSYKSYMGKSEKADERVIDACVQAANVAYVGEKDIEYGREISKFSHSLIERWVKENTNGTFWMFEKWAQDRQQTHNVIDRAYELFKIESPFLFTSYMYYMEKNRPYEKRFYVPRRKTLWLPAQDMQDLEDDLLDTYGLSLPSRTGKSTLCIFFLTWVGMRKPMSHNAMGGHSGQLVKRFFRGLENLTESPEYNFAELFQYANPKMKKVIEKKSSDPAELTINLGKKDEFATLTCRSAEGTWTGSIDISTDGYLYVDDLVRDREHSLSASRMENTYQEYQNKMLDRMNDGAKKILVGTLWSVLDPLVREEHENVGNDRARFRKIPALNENDESNFQYEFNGFSSQYYIGYRDRLDKAEWCAKYQQAPFVREGLTFPVEELRTFDGNVPDDECRTLAVIDPAFGSGDSLSMPICKDFGDRQKYIVDWVHDRRTVAYTIPLVADKIEEHTITELKIEKNRGGDLFAEQLKQELDSRNIRHCHIILENAPVKMSKEDKISGYSDFVKREFLFLSMKKWTEEDDFIYHASDQYRKAFDELTIFSAEGKNRFDDAPDAITQLAMMFEKKERKKAFVMRSPI